MAYLNQKEREDLAQELSKLTFSQARGRMRRLDQKVRLVYLRNVQNTGHWATRYELPTLGARVTLVEEYGTKDKKSNGWSKADFSMVEVVVEPAAGNRT
ncbi:MAG: hypothetical protein SF029_23605 [bacterium]|nr:hypothetical protein [bacterium]